MTRIPDSAAQHGSRRSAGARNPAFTLLFLAMTCLASCGEETPVFLPPGDAADAAGDAGDVATDGGEDADAAGDTDVSDATDTGEHATDGGGDAEEVTPDAEPDVEPDTEPDVGADAEPDLLGDADADIPPDRGPDAPPDVSHWGDVCTDDDECTAPTDFCLIHPGVPDGYCTIRCDGLSACAESPTDWTCNTISFAGCEDVSTNWCGPSSELETFDGVVIACE